MCAIAAFVIWSVHHDKSRVFYNIATFRINAYQWMIPLGVETVMKYGVGMALALMLIFARPLTGVLAQRSAPVQGVLIALATWVLLLLILADLFRSGFPPPSEWSVLTAIVATVCAWGCVRLPEMRWVLRGRAAALVSMLLGALLACGSVLLIFERMIIMSDANSQLSQARLLLRGSATLHVSQALRDVLVFANSTTSVPSYSQYPPGYILPLTAMLALRIPPWSWDVLGTGSLIVLIAWLAGKLAPPPAEGTARRLAVTFALGSPTLFAMSGTLMNHTFTATLLLTALCCFWKAREEATLRPGLLWFLGGLALGWAGITRPLTGTAHAAAWACVGAVWIARQIQQRGRPAGFATFKRLIPAFVGLAIAAAILMAYNAATTGDPFELGYTAANSDRHRLGFRYFDHESHTRFSPWIAIEFTLASLASLNFAALGWVTGSWPALAVAWVRLRGSRLLGIIVLLIVAQVGFYFLYNYHEITFGPRLWFEIIPLLIAILAAGVAQSVLSLLERPIALRRGVFLIIALLAISGFGRGLSFFRERYSYQLQTHLQFTRWMQAHPVSCPTVILVDWVMAEMTGKYFMGEPGAPVWFVYKEHEARARALPELVGFEWRDYSTVMSAIQH